MIKNKNNQKFPVVLFAMLSMYFILLLLGALTTQLSSFLAQKVDMPILEWFVMKRTPELTSFFLFITDFGSSFIILSLAIILTFVFIASRHYQRSSLLWFLIVGGSSMMFFAKAFVQRSRPPVELALLAENLYSFPSGHATMSIILYGFLAWIFWKSKVALKHFFSLLFMLLIVCISISRMYLGVHYFTDVLAGIILGGLWLYTGVVLQNWWAHVARFRKK